MTAMSVPLLPAAEPEQHPLASLTGLAMIAAVLTWIGGSPWTAPLEILVVFFHEASHAFMTLLTGGEVMRMEVTIERGGSVLSAGGNRFLILSAGYLGSLVIGAVLLIASMRTRHDRLILLLVAIAMTVATLLYMRNGFGLVYGFAGAFALFAIARWLPAIASDYALRLIGVMSLMYVPRDIFSDTIQRSQLRSDAFMLAEEFGGSTWFWGGIWLVIAVVIAAYAVFLSVRRANRRSDQAPLST